MQSIIILSSVAVVSAVVVAFILGKPIPESIVGIALGTLAGIAGSTIGASSEKMTMELPANYKLKKMTIEVEEP